MHYSESDTRAKFVDQKLKATGWDVANHLQVTKEGALKNVSGTMLYVDYTLHDTDGTVIALIEAKKFSRSAREGEHQALEYAELLAGQQSYQPFIFLSNGKEIYFFNAGKHQAPRVVKTFFTLADLRRISYLQNAETSPSNQKVDTKISGRHYQIAAIKAVVEGIEQGKRKFLLVMATGTGKTRTAMGLIDVLMKTHHVQKVLFLTDRTALRDQAYDDGFKVYFPEEPMTKIESGKTNDSARLYSATYQTMINYLDRYSSAYFDLIIIDEVHRSLYGERKAILTHFDCYQVGLTATPVQFIERDTYKAFDCHEQGPQYSYGLDEAIEEGYLVPYSVLMARTQFQIQGIKGRQLPKQIREQLIKEGKNPEEYNFEGSEIGKKIDNKDTNRALIREFMEQSYKGEDGLPGKTIIFAMNQAHAEHLQATFEELYPHLYQFSVVITSHVERADSILKEFKKLKKEKKYRVAISVDMLDTGIDVPEIVNLVFAKKVFSEAKFRQMVGRGTRLCPDVYGLGLHKTDFLILDFALNFDETHTFKQPGLQPLPLQQQLFELKIQELKLFEHRAMKKEFSETRKGLLTMIQGLKKNDELVVHEQLIEQIVSGAIFDNMALNPYEQLQKIAPLMRYYDKHTADELRFLIKTEKLRIAVVKEDDTKELSNAIASDINALSQQISKVQAKSDCIREILTPTWRDELSLEAITALQREFTGLMKYKDVTKPSILITDLDDVIIERRMIEYSKGKKMESDKYRAEFVATLEDYAKSSVAIQKILRDEPLQKQDIVELEMMLDKTDYRFRTQTLRQVFYTPTVDFELLIKVALGKGKLPGWEAEVQQLFEQYIQEHNFSSMQIKFLQILKSLIIQNKIIAVEDLYSPVFDSTFGGGAFDRLFKPTEAEEVLAFVEGFRL